MKPSIVLDMKTYLIRSWPFLLFFSLYGLMTYPCLYWGDSGEFSYIATFLGIPHPTGYPLYIPLLKLFSFISIGSPYFLHNLFSALFAALAMMLLLRICLQITNNLSTSWIATLFFALSTNFVTRAGLAEVYTLQVFICLLVATSGLSILRDWDVRKIWMISFLLGLGISHHLTTIMYFPAFFFLLLFAPKGSRNFRLFSGIGLFSLLGLLPYLFIALRGHLPPAFSYPNLFGVTMSSLQDWFWLLSGEIFRSEMASFDLSRHIEDFGYFFYLLFENFYWLGGVIGLLGLVKGIKEQLRPMLFLGLLFLTQTLFFIHYEVPDIHEFYIMSFCLWTPWFATGLNEFRLLLGGISKNKRLSTYLSQSLSILLIIPLWGLFQFYKPVTLDQTPLAYTHRVLSFPQNDFSLFTTYAGRDIFRLLQFLTPIRPDVAVTDYGLDLLKERSRLMKHRDSRDEIFTRQLLLNNTNLMEKKLTKELGEKPVFFSRAEWFLGDKFLQKKIFEAFYSISLKPPPRPLDNLPQFAKKNDVVFGNSLKLLAHAVDPIPLVEGELFTLRLYWQKSGKTTEDITALILFSKGMKGQSYTRQDHFFSELTLGYGWSPPGGWPEGKIIEEAYQITVPTIYPDRYKISLALFDKNQFDRTPFKKIPKSFIPIGETEIVGNTELRHYWDKN